VPGTLPSPCRHLSRNAHPAATPLPVHISKHTWAPATQGRNAVAPLQRQCAPPAVLPSWRCVCAWQQPCCHAAQALLPLLLLPGPGVWAACGASVLQASSAPADHCAQCSMRRGERPAQQQDKQQRQHARQLRSLPAEIDACCMCYTGVLRPITTKRPATVRNPAHVAAAGCGVLALQEPHLLRSAALPVGSFLNSAACSGHAIRYSSKLKLAPASIAQGKWKQRLQDSTRQPSAAPLRLQVVQRRLRARRTSVPTERRRSFSSCEVCDDTKGCLQDRQCQLGGLRISTRDQL
jgi:hypothetical protein